MRPEKRKLILEVFGAWAVVIFLARLLSVIKSPSFVASNLSLLIAVLLLYVPLGIHIAKRERVTYLDWSVSDLGRSLKAFFVLSLAIFPIAFFVNHFYQQILGLTYHPAAFPKVLEAVFVQLIVVALPEEFFFRGYLQGRFNQLLKKRRRLLGVEVGWGLIVGALLFAVSHSLIHYQWWHLLIFFPGLAFGWLREKTGTITAPIFFHAACNLFSHWVSTHYF